MEPKNYMSKINLKEYKKRISKINFKKYAPKIIQDVETLAYVTMTGIGELMQKAASLGDIRYNWAIGHISDIGASGMITALCLMATNKIKNMLAITLAAPTFLSILEIAPLLDKTCTTKYDLSDIACYYGAALAALGIKIASEKIFKKNSSKRDSKNLENIIEKPKGILG